MSRRANGEGSIYQRKDGRWTGAVYVLNRDGGRQRRQVYGTSRIEVAGKVADLLALNKKHVPAAPVTLTVRHFGVAWVDRLAAGGLKPATVSNYRWVLERYVFPSIGRLRLVTLSPQHVRSMLGAVTDSGASPRTVQLTRAVLRSMLADAEREQLVHRNVAALVRGPRVERQEVVPWTRDEAVRFLASLQGHRLHALFAVGVALGLRKGELLALRWDDVDLDTGIVRVRATVQRLGKGIGLVTGTPTTARSRRVLPLPRTLVAVLVTHREAQQRERERAGESWQDSGLVFTTAKGTVIEPRNLNRFLDQATSRAGLRRLRFHDLRHTCASLLLAQGVSPRVVMELLGHSQLSMTTDLYGHVMPSSLRSAADALDGVFGQ
ncbi:MAG TPA: site-specific integrase [Dermatophilaceae bacterium]|nr:site-specific integrase [Dermatophilaceae bacterium]